MPDGGDHPEPDRSPAARDATVVPDAAVVPDVAVIRDAAVVRLLRRPRLLGVGLAALFFVQSLRPSLLPRDWLFQGVVSGLALTLGYVVGATLTWCVEAALGRLGRRPRALAPAADLRLRLGLGLLLAVLVGWASRDAVHDHRWTWERLDHEPSSAWLLYGGTLLVALLVCAALLALAWPVRWLRRRTARAGSRVLPRWIAAVLSTVLVLWLAVTALNTWVYQRTLDALNEAFTVSDLEIDGDVEPPTSRLRSTGPASQVAWEEVGDEGRLFLRRGPTVEQIAAFAPGGEAVEPIRVYVGRATTDDPQERADLALDELERFGAFDREAVLVVVPTGTGWVNEQLVQPVEHLYAGDVATVSLQYSHLPSPLAFLTEEEAAQETGRALIGAVDARIAELPAERRPDLLVAGESLGSFGASAAFDDLDDLVAETTASLWVRPPETVHLRREAEAKRQTGSTQVKPVDGGEEVLFANRDSDIVGHPRAVFLQHADDPIVWWDWQTAVTEPDWLSEPLDPAVNPAMEWAPVSTFLNLAVDMAVSTAFDEDFGHKYGTQPLTAWVAMLQPAGWDEDRVAELRQRLARLPR